MSALVFRSDLLAAIRDYFRREGLLEVMTPVLGRYGTSEPHLDNIEVPGRGFLQTSPEYAMKKLLAAGHTSMYQICPAFRGGETGRRHRQEFVMLEWYRCGYDLQGLADDLVRLINHIIESLCMHHDLRLAPVEPLRVSYRDLFTRACGINPHEASIEALVAVAREFADETSLAHLTADALLPDYLDALFSARIEPGLQDATLVYDYPACQAALAEIHRTPDGDLTADRFELFIGGMEIANAYQELRDPAVLEARFEENNRRRAAIGRPLIEDDVELLASLPALPPCAGIALGLDRLAMLLTGAADIDEVQGTSGSP